MITKFKLFENEDDISQPKYKVGDYVKIQLYKDTDIMLISDIDIIKYRDNSTRTDHQKYQYEGEIEHINHEEPEIIYVMEEYIIKKLTPEEVELYKNMKKYNL